MIKKLFINLILLISVANYLIATENVFDSIADGNSTKIKDKKRNDLNSSIKSSEMIQLKIKKAPNKIYKNQRFAISLEAKVSDDNFDQIETEFLNHSNIEILNKDSSWIDKKNELYANTFYLMATDSNYTMPQITFNVYRNNNLLATKSVEIKYAQLFDIGQKPPMFSNIICDELKVISAKSKYFDQKNIITVIEIQAKNGNLQDMHLKGMVDQGVESLKEDNFFDELTYFVVTPSYQKSIDFEYLNSKENVYKKITIPINVIDDIVSTQTDLNPKDSTFYFYKIYFYIFLTLGLIVYFIARKSKIALYISIMPLYMLYDLTLNNDSCILKKGASIYILPTQNSTVFKVAEDEFKVEIINSNEKFIKVVFPNKQIGWAKKDDIK